LRDFPVSGAQPSLRRSLRSPRRRGSGSSPSSARTCTSISATIRSPSRSRPWMNSQRGFSRTCRRTISTPSARIAPRPHASRQPSEGSTFVGSSSGIVSSAPPTAPTRAAVCAEREVCGLLDAPEDFLHDLPGSTCHTAIVGQQVRGLPWAVAEQLGQAGQFAVVAGQGI
jgi:hypothetical protein